MNIYLDIDGVLIKYRFTERGQANHCTEFLQYLTQNHSVYWLTSHCKHGENRALEHLVNLLEPRAYELVKNIQPADWQIRKTDAIDFTQDFRWIDDTLFLDDKWVLEKNNAESKLIKIDLQQNPDQLIEVINHLTNEPSINDPNTD